MIKIPLDKLIIIVLVLIYMYDQYNLYNLEATFKTSLIAGITLDQNKYGSGPRTESGSFNSGSGFFRSKTLSHNTIKNYLSDLRYFFGWLTLKLKIQSEKLKVEEIDTKLLEEYKSFLVENNLPVKTVNRRLSTIRKFCSFCVKQGWMKENPSKKISNFQIPRTNNSRGFIRTSEVKEDPSLAGDGRTSEVERKDILNDFRSDLKKQGLNAQTIINCLNDVEELLV